MKKNLINSILLFVLIFSTVTSLFAQSRQFTLQTKEYRYEDGNWYTFYEGHKGDKIIPERLIVKLKDKGALENIDFRRYNIKGVSLGSRRFLDGFYVLSIEPGNNPFDIAENLEKLNIFDVMEFDAIGQRHSTPNDPRFNQQWNLTKIKMPDGWDITTGSSSVILSVIDSGIKYTHEDIDGNVWVNSSEDRNGNGRPDFYAYNQGGDLDGIDNDGNGYTDDLVGWDFAGGGNDPQAPYTPDNNPDDTDGHGTNVAGVSSAQTNNYEGGSYKGIAGVAGGWGTQKGASVMILRDGGTQPIVSLTIQAIEYAAENGAKVINISSGFWPEPAGMYSAINSAVNTSDVIIIVSAGNNGDQQDPSIRYPACYSNTMAVGATDQNDSRRSYSAYGPQLDVMAPDGIPSTTMAGGYTSSVSGTSFSSPTVAGLAALIRSINPSLTWQEVRETLRASADKVAGMGGQNFTNYYGYGRINANNAVRNLYVPHVYSTIQSAINAATPGQTVYVSGSQTLSSNITVASNIGLEIQSSATINLNGYSIISTGGTLNVSSGATINGLRAKLTANLDLRGLCGSIQTAATYANSTNEILLENGNFNENVSINNKYSLSIFGNSNYNHFGNLTVSSCNAFQGVGFGAKSVFINNASYVILASINAYGTNQSTIGFSLYNSDTYNVNNLTAENSQTGILCSDGTEADIEQSFLYDNLNGLRSFNGSNVGIYNSYFCGTGLDLQTYNFSSIEAGNCYYDGGAPSTSGSNIYHYGNQNCPLSKLNSNQQTENKDYVTVTNEDKPGGPDFDRINSAYFALNKKLTNAFKEKTDFNEEAFSIDYEKVIEDFKEFIRNNPDSPLAKIALIASAKSYRRIDDIRGKNDFAGMKIFLTDIIENKEYSSLKPQAERLMIDYYRLTKDFTGALKTADNLIENYKEVPDYVCGVLYAKGLILAYDLNQPDKAAESFSYILQQYRKNSLASLAENELRILGKEVGKQTSGEAEIVGNEIELNNYPNPFNPSTTISYSLPEAGNVQIKIFDVLGREVAKLVDETKNAGKHTIIWNGSNNASGIYFYTITFQNQTLFKKMLMIK